MRSVPASGAWRIVVVGDLVVDVVLAPDQPLAAGTDVAGRVTLRPGGSAANTARWLARLGARVTLVSAVGSDPAGRALGDVVRAAGVNARMVTRPGRTGRIGVMVAPDGERSFVADRGAADLLRPEDLRAAWFRGAALVHLPVYSLLGEPLGRAGLEAVRLARTAGALVSLDLASTGPLLAGGTAAARALVGSVRPDLLFATADEARALLDGAPTGRDAEPVPGLAAVERRDAGGSRQPGAEPWLGRLTGPDGLASVAIIKRGAGGVTVLGAGAPNTPSLRVDVAVQPIRAVDTTAAGDAFDAGFIAGWLAARAAGARPEVRFRRAASEGNRAARRQLLGRARELPLL